MSETTRRMQTRCYIREDGSALVLRSGGNDRVIVIADADGNSLLGPHRIVRLAQEAMALLLLRGVTFNDIAGGQGLPDRTLPGEPKAKTDAKPLSLARQAIKDVRIADQTRAARAAAKAGGEKPDATAIAAEADAFVRGLTDAQVAWAVKAQDVRAAMDKRRGLPASLADALGQAASSADDGPLDTEKAPDFSGTEETDHG